MFSVQGWNISAPLQTQVEAPKVAAEGKESKKGKKRKRKGENATESTSKRDKKHKEDHKPEPDPSTSTNASLKPATDAKSDKSNQSTGMISLLEPKRLTPLQKSMRAKLTSARFRHLNETLYTKPSKESLDLFRENPEMFEDYHRGFAQQVEVWPENPVDVYFNTILLRGKIRIKDPWKDKKRKDKRGKSSGADSPNESSAGNVGIKPLPRNMKGHSTIADLGCGTASLSYRLQPHLKSLNTTIQAFDLSKPSGPSANLVTVADVSNLPLPDGSVDVAIFCLALMGTNWLDFIDEAYRILRWKGELWVAEIKSRFGRIAKSRPGKPPINSVGSLHKPDKKAKGKKKGRGEKTEEEGIQGSDDEAELAERVDGVESREGTDVSAFVEVLRKHGFVLDALPEKRDGAVDMSNKMFVKMQFVKGTSPTKGKNAKHEDGRGAGAGGLKMGIKGKKFAAVTDDEQDDADDGKVLKPCLYKIR
ncbi:hypothetical protein CC78DRAFT_554662 [Lojkania enalia]|uniref:Ribosomal RNA-processing protein 8 n=1 Tax=Lojkania enalia TaxID=147567 RepID=A0A9P4K5I7_9PLEO|nr:hypothetical protein CC78DRAFT_554662 [Didymosphaeria enalia]